MNDRFKFRGVLTVEYGGENADEKTVDLIIEKADAIHGGDIGFDIDQLDAAIEKAGITDDIEIDNIHEFCYDNNGCRSDEYFVMDGDIEQCTGLKDKNGNLIYEGDIVEITIFGSIGPNGGYVDSDEIYKGTVIWVRDCFLVKTADMDMILFPHSEDCTEIIGNVHEQAEQKEEQ